MINNKILGGVLIFFCVLLGIFMFAINSLFELNAEASCTCTEMVDGGFCPHDVGIPWQIYFGGFIISVLFALAIYLIFFEKSQKQVVEALSKEKNIKDKFEKLELIMLGMGTDEKKVFNAIADQDGISQSTLGLRTDLHKSKLSIILDGFEKKNLIKKTKKGKVNYINLKVQL